MRRREFIGLLGGVAAFGRPAIAAQPETGVRRVGVLMGVAEDSADIRRMFLQFFDSSPSKWTLS